MARAVRLIISLSIAKTKVSCEFTESFSAILRKIIFPQNLSKVIFPRLFVDFGTLRRLSKQLTKFIFRRFCQKHFPEFSLLSELFKKFGTILIYVGFNLVQQQLHPWGRIVPSSQSHCENLHVGQDEWSYDKSLTHDYCGHVNFV